MTSSHLDPPIQNLALCIVLMMLSGLLRVVATMILAYPEFVSKKKNGRLLHEESGDQEEDRQDQNNHFQVQPTLQLEDGNDDDNDNATTTTAFSKCCQLENQGRSILITYHVALLGVAAILSVYGTVFGPVSIAIPVQTGSQLLWNVIAMTVLQMKSFNKEQRTGTYIIFLSVLSLMEVGPGVQNHQSIGRLVSFWYNPMGFIWSIILAIALIWSTRQTILYLQYKKQVKLQQRMPNSPPSPTNVNDSPSRWNTTLDSSSSLEGFTTQGQRQQQRQPLLDDTSFSDEGNRETNIHHPTTAKSEFSTTRTFVVLLLGVTLSNVAMATSGKALGGGLSNVGWWCALLCYLVSTILGLLFSITSSTACDQGVFTPTSSVALVLVNMMTGIVVWQDYRVLKTGSSWVGYICAFLIMSCGVYLLSNVDLVQEYYYSANNKSQGRQNSNHDMASNAELRPSLAEQEHSQHVMVEREDDIAEGEVPLSLEGYYQHAKLC